jgi:pilus assembly protein CpaF
MYISEVLGAAEDHVIVQDIFRFERTGVSEAGKVQGYFHCVNKDPKVMERLRIFGINLDRSCFDERLEVNM